MNLLCCPRTPKTGWAQSDCGRRLSPTATGLRNCAGHSITMRGAGRLAAPEGAAARTSPAMPIECVRCPHFACNANVMLRVPTIGFDRNDWASLIGSRADLDVERDPAEIGNAAR